MAMVGEALLSASMETLLDKIISTEFRDFFKSRKLNISLLEELSTALRVLRAVLNDAEQKEINDHAVREWLGLLEDAIMDAEDLLDEISYDCLRRKVEGEYQSTSKQVRKLLSSPFNQFYREMNSKMEEMCRRLKNFVEQKNNLGLQSVSNRPSKRTPTTPLMIESDMVGREDEKEQLMSMLLSDDHENSNNVGVVAILGMGGVGKTTLAQLLYNEKKVEEYFDLKAWACVSEDFDVINVTKTLLESVKSSPSNNNNLELLRGELRQALRDKKFLLVLDDLWNEKYNDWNDLRIPFSSGKKGSKIIVTTRLHRVAELSHTFPIYTLQPLSKDECWSLLAKHALGSEDCSRNPNLEIIGRKIANKCDGLPIAAKTLGGLLRSKLDTNEWNDVLNSNLWDLPSNDVLPALRLSYVYLPAHLKRCFAYCSIFPKDYPLDRKKLVLLWMAEGLVQSTHEEKIMEEIGDGVFSELLSRSLIQPLKDVDGDRFVMHDLVNDLAIYVSKTGYFVGDGIKILEDVRHLSYKQEMYDYGKKFENFDSLKHLRSFLPLQPIWDSHLSKKVLNGLFSAHKLLRVLTLSNYRNITELPNSIKNLVHLRYLDLSNTKIKRLPKELCTLYNLQTLLLSNCILLEELPTHLGKLINLRHLDISECKLKVMPVQIGRLENLQTLTTFVVGNHQDGPSVRDLSKFPHLQGTLSILKLQNVNDASEAFAANLKRKEKIEELILKWDENTEDSKIEQDVLYHLQPSANLRELTINGYNGANFPTWLGDSSFCNMVSLCISNCCYCITLPPFGQLPSLEVLRILGMKSLKSVGHVFYGQSGVSNPFVPFPALEYLEFKDMKNWEEWLPSPTEGSQVPFPRLKYLFLEDCPKLRQHLPHHLPSLSTVDISRCYELKTTASTLRWLTSIERLNVEGGDLWSLLGDECDSPCSLQYLFIRSCDSLLSLPRMILGSSCLGSLTLWSIPSLTCFPIGGLPTSLRSLKIDDCPSLEFLPPETWCNYTSLASLWIECSCDSLTSFPLDSFPTLEHLDLIRVRNLESLSISEASVHHPSHLLQLDISYCEKLRSFSERIRALTNLQELSIVGLPELASLAQAGLPLNLQRLGVTDCGRLSPVGIADWGLQHLTSLSLLSIGGDDIVNTLLEEPLLLPNSLLSLEIRNISNLKSVKGNEFQHFNSLQRLCFWSCERLDFIPEDALQRFTNLERLSIFSCPRIESLPENGVRHLTNLKELHIVECPKLESLTENGVRHLTNLKKLDISDCPKLESLPEQGLPSSLSLLEISRCPLLEARYKSQKGKHWSKIAHIPVIHINNEVII